MTTRRFYGAPDTPRVFRFTFPLLAVLMVAFSVVLVLGPSWPLRFLGAMAATGTPCWLVWIWRNMNRWDRQAAKSRQRWAEYWAVCDAAPDNFTARQTALDEIAAVDLSGDDA